MRIIGVDDEKYSLRRLKECVDSPTARFFSNPVEAASEIENGCVPDVAFLDISMPGLDGFALFRLIREKNPAAYVVFVTGRSNYALDAITLGVNSYILKPCHKPSIQKELEKAKAILGGAGAPPVIRTFGYFDLFVDGKPVHFSSAKSKEMLALLVNAAGNSMSMNEIIDVLWEHRAVDNSVKSLYRIALKNLRTTLAAHAIADILIDNRNSRSIDVGKVDCDYFKYLAGDDQARAAFFGEYMKEYSWGEETLGRLTTDWK